MQRHAQVVSVCAQSVTVRLDVGPCSGCTTGCGGRCDLFRPDPQQQLTLPLPGAQVVPGQRVIVAVSDRQLRQAALHGYGRALLGMVLGAAAGALLARWLGMASDPLVLAGLLLGVAAAVWHTRSVAVNPHLSHRMPEDASDS